jgi:hypothetical protein
MLKKYALLGVLLITGALANMAFIPVSHQPKMNSLFSIAATGFARPIVTPSLSANSAHDEIIATGVPRFSLSLPVRVISAHDEIIATGVPRFSLILPVRANSAHDEIIATGVPRLGVTKLQPHIKLNSGH